jgi:hypothetical protein
MINASLHHAASDQGYMVVIKGEFSQPITVPG